MSIEPLQDDILQELVQFVPYRIIALLECTEKIFSKGGAWSRLRSLSLLQVSDVIGECLDMRGHKFKQLQDLIPPILSRILGNLASRDRTQLRTLELSHRYTSPEGWRFSETIFERNRSQITSVSLYVANKDSVLANADLLMKMDAKKLTSLKFGSSLPNKESPGLKLVEFFKQGCRMLTSLDLSIEISTSDSRLLLNTIAETTGNLKSFVLCCCIGTSEVDLSNPGHFGENGECLVAMIRSNSSTLERVEVGVGRYSAHREIWELVLGSADVRRCIEQRNFKSLDALCKQILNVPLRTIYARTGSAWALWAVSELYNGPDQPSNLSEFDPLFELCHGNSIYCPDDFSELVGAVEYTEHVVDPIKAWLPQQIRKMFKRAVAERECLEIKEINCLSYLWSLLYEYGEPENDDIVLLRALVAKDHRVLLNIIADRSEPSQPVLDLILRLLKPEEELANLKNIRFDCEICPRDSSTPDAPLFMLHSSSPMIQPIMEHSTFYAPLLDSATGCNWLERVCRSWSFNDNSSIGPLIKIFVNKFIAQSEAGQGWKRLFDTTHFLLHCFITFDNVVSPLIECLIEHGISRDAFLQIEPIHQYRLRTDDAGRAALDAFALQLPQ